MLRSCPHAPVLWYSASMYHKTESSPVVLIVTSEATGGGSGADGDRLHVAWLSPGSKTAASDDPERVNYTWFRSDGRAVIPDHRLNARLGGAGRLVGYRGCSVIR